MQKQAPIVIECPECGEKYIITSKDNNTRSKEAILYSDGFFIDDINWRTPAIIGCVTCELGFFAGEGKIVAQPSWKEYEKKWNLVKRVAPPTAGALAMELRIRKNMNRNVETDLRKEFWYAGLHSEPGQLLLSKNEKFKFFWNNSLLKLEELLTTNTTEELLIKAEINRQIGHFDICLQLLRNSKQNHAKQLIEAAKAESTSFFKVRQIK